MDDLRAIALAERDAIRAAIINGEIDWYNNPLTEVLEILDARDHDV